MALTKERNTDQMADTQRSPLAFPVKGSTKIWKGSQVVLSAGYAKPGAAATGLIAVGRAKKTVDNSSGGDGALWIEVEEGIFKWGNNAAGSDAVVAADVGATVYIEDDYNVCHTGTGKSAAGKVAQLDSDGVWVKTVL